MHTRVNVVRRPPPPQTVTFGLTPLGWKSPAPLTPALNHARADLERALLTFFFFFGLNSVNPGLSGASRGRGGGPAAPAPIAVRGRRPVAAGGTAGHGPDLCRGPPHRAPRQQGGHPALRLGRGRFLKADGQGVPLVTTGTGLKGSTLPAPSGSITRWGDGVQVPALALAAWRAAPAPASLTVHRERLIKAQIINNRSGGSSRGL